MNSIALRCFYQSQIALCFLLLAACGGGGGGEGGGVSPPPPTVDDTSFGNLAITSDNAELIGVTLSLAEGALSFTQVTVNTVIRFAGDGLGVRDCGNSGSASVVLRDNDTSFGISPGDEVDITYSNCFDSLIDGAVDGSVTILVTAFSLDASMARLAGDIVSSGAVSLVDPANPGASVELAANHAFDFNLQASESLAVAATGAQQLQVAVDGVAETLSEFAITKIATRFNVGTDTETTADLFYDSTLFGGTFTCNSGPIAFRSFNDLPDSASVTCRGLNGSAVRISSQNVVSVDPEGDGTFTDIGVFDWTAVLDGFLKSDSGLNLGDVASEIPLRRFAVANNDVIYDPDRTRIIVSTAATDPVNPNALLAVAPVAGTVETLLTFVDEPNLVRLSADGGRIFVSFTDSAQIHSYDATTLQLQAQFEVTSNQAFSTTYGIVDMDVSPADPGTIAVVFQFLGTGNTDIAMFDGAAQLSSSYRDAVGNLAATNWDRVTFSADGTRVLGTNSRSTGAEALEVNPSGIVAAVRLVNVMGGDIERYGNRLLMGNVAFDATSFVRVGTYAATVRASALDPGNGIALTYSAATEALGAFELTTFVPLGEYGLGLNDPVLVESIVPAGDVAAIVEPTTLHLVSLADLETQLTGECDVVSLVTDENEAVTNIACPITDVVYDSTRDKIYAATSSDIGVNGNSLVVIDRATSTVEQYLPIGSEPKQLALSADENLLYAIFSGADALVTVDLNGRVLSRVQQIDLDDSIQGQLEARQALRLQASTTDPDTLVMSLGELSGSPFERLTVFRSGTRLDDDVFQGDLQGGPSNLGPFVFFDDSGQAYSLNNVFPPNVQTLNLGPTGLSAGVSFDVGDTFNGPARPDVSGSEVFTSNGGFIDLTSQASDARYDTNAPGSTDGRGGRAVNADPTNDDVYYLIGGPTGSVIARYDYATGALLAEQAIDFFPGSFVFEQRLIDIGANALGILPNPNLGLLLLDKAAIQ